MLRVIDCWNRWSKKCFGFSILGNSSKPSWTQPWAICCHWRALSRGVGVGILQMSLPVSAVLWFSLNYLRAKPISVAVEMKLNTGVERQNIFVCIHRQVCLFVPPSFIWQLGKRGENSLQLRCSLGCLSFLLLIPRLRMALLSAVSSHSCSSSSEAAVSFPAAQNTEHHQRL